MMLRRLGALLVLVWLFGTFGGVAKAIDSGSWAPGVERATDYARERRGEVTFATIDEKGKLRGFGQKRTAPAASVFKGMLLAAYLRQASVRERRLRERDRDLLEPMIRWSDNATASRVRDTVGARAIYRLAERAGMRDFRLSSTWGLSRTSARDQARYFFTLDDYVPERHEAYARSLLRTIVRSQRWGIAAVTPPGWALFFKGGWGAGTGRVDHQVAFLERGERRIALAILTEHSPSHSYGKRTLRGVAKRLTRDLRLEAETP